MSNLGQVVPSGIRHGQKIELNPGLENLETSLIGSLACRVERNKSLQLARCSHSVPGTDIFFYPAQQSWKVNFTDVKINSHRGE